VANLCDAVDADIHDVARGIGLDQRIGNKFLHAGPGYGGSCFPKDVQSLTHFAREAGVELKLAAAANEVNQSQRERMVDKIVAMLDNDVSGKTIGVLGLAFKPNTDDIREAPAIAIIKALQAKGAKIKAHDPVAKAAAKEVLPEVEYCQDSYSTCDGSDALVLATEWNEFRALDLERVRNLLHQPIMIDLRNVYEPGKMQGLGFRYAAVGRRGAQRV
jgi:UDPglucose 6-dehydrogenase